MEGSAAVETGLLEQARTYIETHRHERQVNKVLHGFPSPRLWQETAVPVGEMLTERRHMRPSQARSLQLYIATPYCLQTAPEKCGYCLFPVEVFTGMSQLERYLSYLELEGHMYQEFFEGEQITNLYFGGGTSNLYKAEQYPRLMEIVRQTFPRFAPNAIVTLEGIPQLFTREKLLRMKEGGVNRISMGAQQLNDELNQLSGRRQKPQHVFQAVEWCQELGLECNVDLIFGWPRQTRELMLEGLEQLVATGIRHITHYELNIGGASDFALNHRHELPSVEENRRMYHASKQYLESQGFRQLTPYDFEKPAAAAAGAPLYEECLRGFDCTDVWGWGYAGVSGFQGSPQSPGWMYVNYRTVDAYFAAIDRGQLPIERGFHFEQQDLRLATLYRNLQGMEADRANYLSTFGVDLVEEHRPIWKALEEVGWVEITPASIRLVGDGVFYTPMIQTLLGLRRTQELTLKTGPLTLIA
jgi:oxygen-independent coproporphyrinogen-3 oxidase